MSFQRFNRARRYYRKSKNDCYEWYVDWWWNKLTSNFTSSEQGANQHLI